MTAIIYFLLWAALIFLMLRFGCGAHVLGYGRHHEHRAADDREITLPRETTDPVCGMLVNPGTAKSSVHDRRIYYFCSNECREKFETAPLAYVKGAAVSPASKEVHYGAH